MIGPARAATGKSRVLKAGVVESLELGWRAGRGRLVLMVLLTLVGAALPVTAAWFMKETIDRLVRPDADPGTVFPAILGFVTAGLLIAVLTRVVQYLGAESNRAVALLAQDRLFAALERCTGIARFENPSYQDTLRLAQQATGYASGQVLGSER